MMRMQHISNNCVVEIPSNLLKNALELTALSITKTKIDGEPAMISFWKLSKEEISLISKGFPVALVVMGTEHPPVKLSVGLTR